MSDGISTAKAIALIKALGGGGGGTAHGIPSGGSTGQILRKTSGTDYDVGWSTNSLHNLSDTYALNTAQYGNVLAYSEYMDWRPANLRGYMGYFEDDGQGNVVLELDNGHMPGYVPPDGFSGYVVDNDSVDQSEQYDLMWANIQNDEYGNPQSVVYWFFSKQLSTPFNLNIKKFASTYDSEMGEWSPCTEQTAASTHEVSHTWVGTAAEYAALSPNYDANTLYSIKEA